MKAVYVFRGFMAVAAINLNWMLLRYISQLQTGGGREVSIKELGQSTEETEPLTLGEFIREKISKAQQGKSLASNPFRYIGEAINIHFLPPFWNL